MAATSLKLTDELKRRIERLAGSAGQTPHAYMVETLVRETARAELRARFAADSADSEKEAVASNKAHDLTATFDYLAARLSGRKTRRPRARSWRASK